MPKRKHRRAGINWCGRQNCWIIDKKWKGQRLYIVSYTDKPDEAEALLDAELEKLRKAMLHGERPRYLFYQGAEKYLEERQHLASFKNLKVTILRMLPILGNIPLCDLHDATLKPYIKWRKKEGVKTRKKDAKTNQLIIVTRTIKHASINRDLEVVRTILLAAWRSWRCELTGKPWIDNPTLISMLPTKPQKGQRLEEHSGETYSLSWAEQDKLFPLLSPHLQAMCLFKVNTGTREQEVCKLRWDWEYDVPELKLSLFIVPEGYVKNGEARLIIPNQIARSVIEEQRRQWFGQSDFVFPNLHTKRPFTKIRNNGWRTAWDKASLPTGHNICHGVHVLKHTCGRRLRAAGVSRETRKICLGHSDGDITTHYSAAEIQEVLSAFELLCKRREGIVAKPRLSAI
jgi:integrase